MRLEIVGITKRFGDLVANDDVTITVEPGEIHCLLGENGAGKSTLMNVLFGLLHADAGEIRIDGEALRFADPGDAVRHGIGMVHQHFMLVPVFTVAENVELGFEPTRPLGWLDRRRARADVRRLSAQFGLEVEPEAIVENLPVGVQQRVEILKALQRDAQLLILDEPTAVLTPQETEALFAIMRSLQSSGRSILFITHKLKEVLAVADTITVMRLGRVVGTTTPAEADEATLASMMVGRDVELVVAKEAGRPAAPVLQLEGLTVVDDRGVTVVDHVDLDVRAGEIVALAGVQGNGQTELAEAITGLRPVTDGSVRIDGRDLTGASPRAVLRAGVAHVPEDRQEDGLVLSMTIAENLILDMYDDPPFARHGVRDLGEVTDNGQRRIREFDIRGEQPRDPRRGAVGWQPTEGRRRTRAVATGQAAPRLATDARPRRRLDRVRAPAHRRRARRRGRRARHLVRARRGARARRPHRGDVPRADHRRRRALGRSGGDRADDGRCRGVHASGSRPAGGRHRGCRMSDDATNPAAVQAVPSTPVPAAEHEPSQPGTGEPVASEAAAGEAAAGDAAAGEAAAGDAATAAPSRGRPATGGPATGGPATGEPWWYRAAHALTEANPFMLTFLALASALVLGAVLIDATSPTVIHAWSHVGSHPGRTLSLTFTTVGDAYAAIFTGSVFSPSVLWHAISTGHGWSAALTPLSETGVAATPLILTGIGVALGFQAGVFNIGGQGQFIAGALAALYVGFELHLPIGIHLPLVVLAGAAGGAIAGFIPGILKARTGAHEVIVTIMLNYVFLYLLEYLLSVQPFQQPNQTNSISRVMPTTARMPHLPGGLRVNVALLIALAMASLVSWFLRRSTLGFSFRVIGANPSAGRTAGMSPAKVTTLVLTLSGLLCGMAGMSTLSGTDFYLSYPYGGNNGFNGITVALLGRNKPLGVVLGAFLFGALQVGGQNMQANTGIPIDLASVIQATVVFFIATPLLVSELFRLRPARAQAITISSNKGWGA